MFEPAPSFHFDQRLTVDEEERYEPRPRFSKPDPLLEALGCTYALRDFVLEGTFTFAVFWRVFPEVRILIDALRPGQTAENTAWREKIARRHHYRRVTAVGKWDGNTLHGAHVPIIELQQLVGRV